MLEKAAKAAKTHLENDLSDKLVIIATYWSGQGDAITLPDPVTWLYGYQPTVVDRAIEDFPIVCVMALEERPIPGSHVDQGTLGEGLIPILVQWFVESTDEEECNKICQRYGEAIDEVMHDHMSDFDTTNGIQIPSEAYVPETKLSSVMREREENSSTEHFTQYGEKTWVAQVRHTG